jgi:hypothetical protein
MLVDPKTFRIVLRNDNVLGNYGKSDLVMKNKIK